MLDSITKRLFDSSKRRKTGEASPTSTGTLPPTRTRRVVTYSSGKKRKADALEAGGYISSQEDGPDALPEVADSGTNGSSFVDSAYGSITPTHETSSKDTTDKRKSVRRGALEPPSPQAVDKSAEVETPLSKRKGRSGVSKRSKENKTQTRDVQGASDDDGHGGDQHRSPQLEAAQPAAKPRESPADENPDQALRSSGRTRRKTRRLEEAESAPQCTKSVEGQPMVASSPLGRTPRKTKPPKATQEGEGAPNSWQPETPTKRPKPNSGSITASGKKRGCPRKNGEASADAEKDSADMLFTDTHEPEPEAFLPGEEGDATSEGRASAGLSTEQSIEEATAVLQDLKFAGHLAARKAEVLKNLTGKARIPLVGLDDEYQRVAQLVDQTVAAGEGNSMLLIGARGSAKSNLVETVLAEAGARHPGDFYVVRLSGFIHTDDKLALRDIWRQLGRELDPAAADAAAGPRGSHAEILASLLALLAHAPGDGADPRRASRAVVFVLDAFERFAAAPRQTLLYNLFDVAQARTAPVAVLGLTPRFDVVAALEKRVRSRFSHRHVHLPLPRSLPGYIDVCRAALLALPLDGDHASPFLAARLGLAANVDADADARAFHAAWTRYVAHLLATPPLPALLAELYYGAKSVPAFLHLALLPFAGAGAGALPAADAFARPATALRPPPATKRALLASLGELPLALLVAAARLDAVLDADACTFELVHAEHRGLAARLRTHASVASTPTVVRSGGRRGGPQDLGSSPGGALGGAAGGGGAAGRAWGREAALRAWEELVALELVVPAAGGGGEGRGVGAGADEGAGRGRLWRVDVGLEEIGESEVEMSAAMRRWCREI